MEKIIARRAAIEDSDEEKDGNDDWDEDDWE